MDMSQITGPDAALPAMVTCVIDGLLEDSDLRELSLRGAAPSMEAVEDNPADLKRVREKHHSVARLLSGGLTQRMVSHLSGYTESYLSILLNNPAMQELVELYRIKQGAGVAVITEKLRSVGLKAVEALDEKMDKNELSNQELLQAAKLGLDRGGHGPASKQHIVNENHIIDHAELAERNRQALERSTAYIVPSSEVRAALSSPAPTVEVDDEAAG